MTFRFAVLGFAVIAAGLFWLGGDAQAQKTMPFVDSPAHLRCFQNGVEILSIDTREFTPRGRGDNYIDYITTDGRRGQLRFSSSTMCSTEENPEASPAA